MRTIITPNTDKFHSVKAIDIIRLWTYTEFFEKPCKMNTIVSSTVFDANATHIISGITFLKMILV